MSRLPEARDHRSSFGVGYDHIDAAWAGAHGITVTNTPDVLNEEVADTALGLLLCTVRELPQADRYLRAGKWPQRRYPLTQGHPARPHRRHGRHGPHRPGDRAPARGGSACRWSITRAIRRRASPTKHYPKLVDMARDVDTLMLILPGGAATKNMINAEVLKALGPNGIAHQHGARLGGRRAGADQGAAGQDHPVGRPRRVRRRAEGAGAS